ncbi:MAG: membrane protein [Cyclobacteriaceae bacterium]|nr:MAG: membrane protein [Cyclobacteriaceae bacterium]
MDKRHRLFLILAGFFITNTLIAEFIGIKIFSLEETFGFKPLDMKLFGVEGLGFNLTAGVMLWPVVFVMTDIINEYYGKKGVRFLSNMAVALILYAFLIFYAGIKLVPNEWWQFQSGIHDDPSQSLEDMDLAFRRVFGQGLWIIIGSLVAFLVGQVVDVLVFHRIKRATGEGKVWLRATGSTVVSQFIDSYVVLVIAFYVGADWDIVRVLAIGTVNYLYKFSLAIILTPMIYLGHYLIDRYLGEKLATKMKQEAQAGTN